MIWKIVKELNNQTKKCLAIGTTSFAVKPIQIFITVKAVCNDHLYNKIYYLWFIQ